jgi:hypothetical protein
VIAPYDEDDPDPDRASPPGGCPTNQARVEVIEVGTLHHELSSTSDVVMGVPMTGPDSSDEGAPSSSTEPGGTTANCSSRSASAWVFCLLAVALTTSTPIGGIPTLLCCRTS